MRGQDRDGVELLTHLAGVLGYHVICPDHVRQIRVLHAEADEVCIQIEAVEEHGHLASDRLHDRRDEIDREVAGITRISFDRAGKQ